MQVNKANEINRKYYYCRDNFHHYSSYPHIHTFTSLGSILTNCHNAKPNVQGADDKLGQTQQKHCKQ